MEQELRKLKEEFDFLHNKIGELEWEKATLYNNRIGVCKSEIDRINIQLENYRENIGIVIEKVKDYIQNNKKIKKTTN